MTLDLESLGITKEQLIERIVDSVSESLIGGDREMDVEGFYGRLQEHTKEATDAAVDRIAEEHLIPYLDRYIEEVKFTKTSEYGEKKGEPVTFLEYLTERGRNWLMTPVNYAGEPVKNPGYNRKAEQTRIVHLIDKRLNHTVEIALENAMKEASKTLGEGLRETAQLQLDIITKRMRGK